MTAPRVGGRPDAAATNDSGPRVAVGSVAKPLGLRGEVLVKLTTDRIERVSPGSFLWAAHPDAVPSPGDPAAAAQRAGDEILLEVERSRPHGRGWAVHFKGTRDRDEATRISGRVLLATPLDVPGVLWVHELVGREVRDRFGTVLGTVEAVEANPASDLLVLDSAIVVPLCFLRDPGSGEDLDRATGEAGAGNGSLPEHPGHEVDREGLQRGRDLLIVDIPDGLVDACGNP